MPSTTTRKRGSPSAGMAIAATMYARCRAPWASAPVRLKSSSSAPCLGVGQCPQQRRPGRRGAVRGPRHQGGADSTDAKEHPKNFNSDDNHREDRCAQTPPKQMIAQRHQLTQLRVARAPTLVRWRTQLDGLRRRCGGAVPQAPTAAPDERSSKPSLTGLGHATWLDEATETRRRGRSHDGCLDPDRSRQYDGASPDSQCITTRLHRCEVVSVDLCVDAYAAANMSVYTCIQI